MKTKGSEAKMKAPNRNKILLVNASRERIQAIGAALEREQFEVESVELNSCLEIVRTYNAAVVVLENLSIEQASRFVAEIRFASPWTQIVVTVGTTDPASLLSLVKAGAYDCLSNGISDADLSVRILKAWEFSHLQNELVGLRQHVAMNYGFDNIVGISKAITKVRESVAKVAPTDIPVMFLGESGTGRELLARVVHHHSNRRQSRFVGVDCSAFNRDQLSREIFGSGEGRTGALWEADGGTLFLDEIDDMPGEIQARLTDFLKTSSLTDPRTGQAEKLDIRIITAGSANLPQTLREIKFSEELFYKLSVLPIKVPSLAERVEDVELLADYFLRKTAHEAGRGEIGISRGAVDLLTRHQWPGNVRELENTLRRAATLCRNSFIDTADIAFISTDDRQTESEGPHKTTIKKKTGLLDDNQRNVIARALDENDWNFTQTALELGIGRTTLWRKVKKYDLKRETVSV